jgi:polysaccharide biosynthesis transport protein
MTGQAEEFDLRSTALMFWRHRRFLLASIILLGGLATLLGSQRPPMYTAETLVALSPQESRILSSEAVEPSLTPNEQTIGTQISIIGSRQHARRTVEELRLAEVPEFAGQDVEGVPGKLWRLARAQVEDWLGRSWMASATTSEVPPAPAAGEQPVGEEAVTSAFLKRLAVRNVPRSLVIGIAFTSRDPELAARAANTVAELYVADQRQAKLEALFALAVEP